MDSCLHEGMTNVHQLSQVCVHVASTVIKPSRECVFIHSDNVWSDRCSFILVGGVCRHDDLLFDFLP